MTHPMKQNNLRDTTMSTGLERDRQIKVTAITITGESFTFETATSREAARTLARTILRDGFNINEVQKLRPGEEQYFPPVSVYKVAIHYATNPKKGA